MGIDTEKIEMEQSWFKPEVGREYEVSFSSADTVKRTVTDFVTKQPVEKTFQLIRIDSLNGRQCAKEWSTNNLQLLNKLRSFESAGMLYNHIFKMKATLNGKRIDYDFIQLRPKA